MKAQTKEWVFDDITSQWAKKQVTGNAMSLSDAYQMLGASEFGAYEPYLGEPGIIIDYACGLGRVAAYINRYAKGKWDFILADSDHQSHPHLKYGYGTSEFYNSFKATHRFCAMNGLDDFAMFDVVHDDWDKLIGIPDVIISMLGVGFHNLMEDHIERLHKISKPTTKIIFGIACEDDFPIWEDEHDFSKWFSKREVVSFKTNYRTHEGRVVILSGRV